MTVKMIFNRTLINEDRYDEIQHLDLLIRELQSETLNEDWGYWHFSLLNLDTGDNLESRVMKTLSEISEYREHSSMNPSSGTKTYISILDLKNLKFNSVENLKNLIVLKADYWAYYQGPTTDKNVISDKFHLLKFHVADEIFDFLNKKEILKARLVDGIDTYYSFGGDHCGDDILVETSSGVYVIHFGFSS